MLRSLTLRDFVIVDRLELDFEPGFTALTGETGAGKSILVDALSLLLGGRADASAIRAGCERAEAAARFEFDAAPELDQWLAREGLDEEAGVLLIRRVIDAGGRSRGFVNGRPATLQQLREAADLLAEIHGQHEHQSLLKPAVQRACLDDFGGASDLARAVEAAWRDWRALDAELATARAGLERAQRERDLLGFELRELQALDLAPGRWREAQEEHARLAHLAELREGAAWALDSMIEGEASAASTLSAAAHRVRELAAIDAQLASVAELLDSAQAVTLEAGHELSRYLDRAELDPERLAELEAWLAAMHQVARKHRIGADDLPGLLADMQARLDGLASAESIETLQARAARAEQDYRNLAVKLGAARAKAAKALAKQVTQAMRKLAMAGGVFEARLDENEPAAHGLENVVFHVAPHAGQPAGALARIASGGELSRIGLALQTALGQSARAPTMVFDEVDAGIGGGVAEAVGRMLRELAGTHQVLVITHLPQVAAQAHQQLRVSKETVAGRAVSRIATLDDADRIEEVARMLGGVEITEATRAHAREMLARGGSGEWGGGSGEWGVGSRE
jgi:DNA repair protein RecN (Recombination protein N)